MKQSEYDILAFGAHPDDVELGCGGTLIKEASSGAKIAICDLTQGELGTRGSVEFRKKEAVAATEIMGVKIRHNCALQDGFFQIDDDAVKQVIREIRFFRPHIVICNAPSDRHPDHGRAAELVKKAAFLSGLSKIATEREGKVQPPWRPERLYHYIQFKYLEPDIIVDISSCFDQKMSALKAYGSQFYNPDSDEPVTLVASKQFIELIRSRCVEFGMRIGVDYAEGFIADKTPGTALLSNVL